VDGGGRNRSDGHSERLSCLTLRQAKDVAAGDYLALAARQSVQCGDEYDRVFAWRWCGRLVTQRVEPKEKPRAPPMRAPAPERYNEKPCVRSVDWVRATPAQPSLERVL